MKGIKKMSENELLMAKAVCDFHPFARDSVLINKGDIKAPDWNRLLKWADNFSNWDDDEDWSIPMKDMKRMERRKATFRKDKGRQTLARDLGYNLSSDMTSGKVKNLLSANHSDKKYFRGSKAQKKLGKPMTTKEALDLVEQMEWEAEEDREVERLEAERAFAKVELDDKKFQLDKLACLEDSLKKTVSELIRTVYEANSQLKELEPQLNGLRLAKHYLEVEISKLEEAVNS